MQGSENEEINVEQLRLMFTGTLRRQGSIRKRRSRSLYLLIIKGKILLDIDEDANVSRADEGRQASRTESKAHNQRLRRPGCSQVGEFQASHRREHFGETDAEILRKLIEDAHVSGCVVRVA